MQIYHPTANSHRTATRIRRVR